MAADRHVSVIGLGFGDCGKGLCTDALVHRFAAHTVVRFNGGAQAGHNVVLPDGRSHTFSQFGAGTFSAGVVTVLARPVVVHPTALFEEARVLERAGARDAFERLLIDPRCRLTTPFHQAAGRLRERCRGAAAHGSCGAGFGETVRHALAHPDEALHWGDLARNAGDSAERLEATRRRLQAEMLALAAQCDADADADADADSCAHSALHTDPEWRLLADPHVATRWLERAREAAARARAAPAEAIPARLAQRGTVVFEGAQGVLLDERFGFHPHTTWSSTGRAAVESVSAEADRPAEALHLGIVRSYLTRHGAGPLPSEDAALDAAMPECHNRSGGWQGRFRRGHADAVLLRYAIAAAGPLDGLVVSHLDAFDGPSGLRWCAAYRVPPGEADPALCVTDPVTPGRIVALRLPAEGDLGHASRLGALLGRVEPEFEAQPPYSAGAFIARIEATAELPVLFGVHGPTHRHLAPIADNAFEPFKSFAS